MIDRKAVRKFGIDEAPSDFALWQAQSYERRLEALEAIRQEYHAGQDDSQQRLQRVCRIVKLFTALPTRFR